jgi:formylglycine-generating enzyme required for sulfatase activity
MVNKRHRLVIPNPFGLSDTNGNVWEWSYSEYDEKYGGKEQQFLRKNNANSANLVVRGGSWNIDATGARAANRFTIRPSYRSSFFGFRAC